MQTTRRKFLQTAAATTLGLKAVTTAGCRKKAETENSPAKRKVQEGMLKAEKKSISVPEYKSQLIAKIRANAAIVYGKEKELEALSLEELIIANELTKPGDFKNKELNSELLAAIGDAINKEPNIAAMEQVSGTVSLENDDPQATAKQRLRNQAAATTRFKTLTSKDSNEEQTQFIEQSKALGIVSEFDILLAEQQSITAPEYKQQLISNFIEDKKIDKSKEEQLQAMSLAELLVLRTYLNNSNGKKLTPELTKEAIGDFRTSAWLQNQTNVYSKTDNQWNAKTRLHGEVSHAKELGDAENKKPDAAVVKLTEKFKALGL